MLYKKSQAEKNKYVFTDRWALKNKTNITKWKHSENKPNGELSEIGYGN